MKSIRLYLIVVILATITLANFIAAINGYRQSLQAAEAIQLEQLEQLQQRLVNLLDAKNPNFDGLAENVIFQVWKQRKLLYASSDTQAPLLLNQDQGIHFINYNNRRWQILANEVSTNSGTVTLYVGLPSDLFTQLIENIILEAVLPIILILPLLAVLIWLLVSYGLSPLSHLAKQLQHRASNDLKPLDSEHYPHELTTVVNSVNALFQRLDDAFERERRFSADAAHELRTPLTTLKLSLHNLRHAEELDLSVIDALEASVERMVNSVEQILTLSKLSADNIATNATLVDWHKVAQQAIIEHYPQIQEKQQTISLEGEARPFIADQFAIETLTKNLLDNASKYSPKCGDITLILTADNDEVQLSIHDSGPGIPANLYQRVFDRFYRIGGDRHASGVTGSGLGLSLVSQVVDAHQGHIDLSTSIHGGLCVRVRLPNNVSDLP